MISQMHQISISRYYFEKCNNKTPRLNRFKFGNSNVEISWQTPRGGGRFEEIPNYYQTHTLKALYHQLKISIPWYAKSLWYGTRLIFEVSETGFLAATSACKNKTKM
jgi:hypothetical protein